MHPTPLLTLLALLAIPMLPAHAQQIANRALDDD